MRIGIVCYPTHGGSGVVATELGKELALRGHTVHFISYQMPFRLDGFHRNVFYHEVSMLAYPLFKHPPYTLALINRIAEMADREKTTSSMPTTSSPTPSAPTWPGRSWGILGSAW